MMESRIRSQTLIFRSPFFDVSRNISIAKTRAGSTVPDWRNKLKRSIDATSAYSLLNTVVTGVIPGHWVVHATWDDPAKPTRGEANGFVAIDFSPPVDPSTFIPTSLDNHIKSKFVQRCLDTQKSFNGLDVLGQLRQTVHDIRHPVAAFRQGLSSYLSLAKERARRAAKGIRGKKGSRGIDSRHRRVASAIQGTWLEYAYGWIPNLQDAEGAIHAAAHLVDPDLPVRKSVSASGHFAVNLPQYYFETGSGYNVAAPDGTILGTIGYKQVVKAAGSIRYSGAVRCTTPGHDRVKLLGFSLRDFVPTAWDLIPYSFLIDYFVNVSDILDALSFNVGDLSWGCKAVKSTLYLTASSSQFKALSSIHIIGSYLEDSPSSYTIENTSYTRFPIFGGTLIPSVEFSFPSFRQDFNIAALVGQHSSVVNFLAKLL